MASDGFAMLVIGVAVGYFIWGNEPNYVDAVKMSEEGGGESYILAKTTLGTLDQVAVIHGLIDDRTGCLTMLGAMERDGGSWICAPASAATYGRAWWHFW